MSYNRHLRNRLLDSKQPFPEAPDHEEALKRCIHIAGVPKVVESRRHAGALHSKGNHVRSHTRSMCTEGPCMRHDSLFQYVADDLRNMGVMQGVLEHEVPECSNILDAVLWI